MHYIIKSCPNLVIYKGQDLICYDVGTGHGKSCADSYCLLKHIREKCLNIENFAELKLAQDILELLDIEIVESEQ